MHLRIMRIPDTVSEWQVASDDERRPVDGLTRAATLVDDGISNG